MALVTGCGDDSGGDSGDRAADSDTGADQGRSDPGAAEDDGGPADADNTDALAGTLAAEADSCDLGGSWVVHRVGFASVDSPLVSGIQKSTRWYYLEIEQAGDEIRVTDGVWCGDVTTGDATVRYSDETYLALRSLADTTGREGSYVRTGDGCELSLERIYWAYGVEPREDYLPGLVAPPGRIEGDPELDALTPLPSEDGDGVTDVDGEGNPGAQSLIIDTPVGSGVRHALQRGWEEIAGATPTGVSDFRVPARYDFDEVAIVSMPAAFNTNAFVRADAPHEARFVRMDGSVVGADHTETCERVRALLPHRAEPRDAF